MNSERLYKLIDIIHDNYGEKRYITALLYYIRLKEYLYDCYYSISFYINEEIIGKLELLKEEIIEEQDYENKDT